MSNKFSELSFFSDCVRFYSKHYSDAHIFFIHTLIFLNKYIHFFLSYIYIYIYAQTTDIDSVKVHILNNLLGGVVSPSSLLQVKLFFFFYMKGLFAFCYLLTFCKKTTSFPQNYNVTIVATEMEIMKFHLSSTPLSSIYK